MPTLRTLTVGGPVGVWRPENPKAKETDISSSVCGGCPLPSPRWSGQGLLVNLHVSADIIPSLWVPQREREGGKPSSKDETVRSVHLPVNSMHILFPSPVPHL